MQLVKDENNEWEQDAARFEEDTRLLREAHERNEWGKIFLLEAASDSICKSKERFRKTTGGAKPGGWFTIGTPRDA
eukprot:2702035-Karenia_brevis.AAC.1